MSSGLDLRLWSVVMQHAAGGVVTLRHACEGVTTVTGVDGTAAVLATSATLRETAYVSDETAGRVEELTLSLGEGPGVDAVRHGEPVLSADMAGSQALARWPVFAPAVVAVGAHAVFALPLRLGAIRLGVLTMYCRQPGGLTGAQLADGLTLAQVVCLLLLDRTDPAAGTVAAAGSDWAWYPEVHQATGMVIVQLGVSAETAFARLRAHAFAHNRRLPDVARDVVTRRLRFNPDNDDYADGR